MLVIEFNVLFICYYLEMAEPLFDNNCSIIMSKNGFFEERVRIVIIGWQNEC